MAAMKPAPFERTEEAAKVSQEAIHKRQERALTLPEIAAELRMPLRTVHDLQMAWLWPRGVPKRREIAS
jgi:hypothetical protein